MKRIVITLGICFTLCNVTSAQDFMQSWGIDFTVMYRPSHRTSKSKYDALQQNLISYFPKYLLADNRNSSVSIGIPLGVGVGVISVDGGMDGGFVLSTNIPLVLDYNMGCKSTPYNRQNFGGYFGLGLGYSKTWVMGSDHSNFAPSSYGPLARGGIRFHTKGATLGTHYLAIGLLYRYGMGDKKMNMAGIQLFADF